MLEKYWIKGADAATDFDFYTQIHTMFKNIVSSLIENELGGFLFLSQLHHRLLKPSYFSNNLRHNRLL